MTLKNIVRINISKKFINVMLKYKDTRTDILDKNQLYLKIFEILKYDKKINEDIKFDAIYWKEIDESFQGIFLPEKNCVIYFTQILKMSGKERSRNTYICQNFNNAFMFSKEKNATLSISINPYDLNQKIPRVNSIQNDIKTLITLGVDLNKSMGLFNIKPYDSLENYLIEKSKLKSKNSKNNSSFINMYDNGIEKTIVVFGKLDGANANDTLNACRIIYELKKNIKKSFFNISENKIPTKYTKIFKELDFKIENSSNNQRELEENLFEIQKSKKYSEFDLLLKRNQPTFIKNIIDKYSRITNFNIHRCFCCENIIEENFIAAHIHRFSDIKKDFTEKKINFKEAANLITSGDNGFLLCPNQDKEFEKGMIIFDLESKKFIANINKLNEKKYDQINKNILSQDFSNVNFSSELVNNIKKHLQRINIDLF